jgi:pilus assembly protein CpaF
MEEAFKPILVMSPNWVVIGEAKGAEVAQMIQGSLRGHDIMGTMHTKYRNSFLTDVIDMVKQDGRIHDDQSLRSRIARAFNILIFLRLIHVEGRLRRVITEITELSADENDQVSVRPIVLWNYESQTWQFTGEKLSRSLVEHMRTRQTDMNEFRRLGVIN